MCEGGVREVWRKGGKVGERLRQLPSLTRGRTSEADALEMNIEETGAGMTVLVTRGGESVGKAEARERTKGREVTR